MDESVDVLMPNVSVPDVGWSWAGDAWVAYYFDISVPDPDLLLVYPAANSNWVIATAPHGDEPVVSRVEAVVEALPPQPASIGPRFALSQRVEAVDVGIAAAFPDDWVVETEPMTADADALIDRWAGDLGIDAEWLGTLSATGPIDERLGVAPSCRLTVFDRTEITPQAWISRIVDGDRCYVVDETTDGLVHARVRPSDCGRLWAPSQGGVEHFARGSGSKIAYVNCWSKDPPGERGSAIARSVEFLPVEE